MLKIREYEINPELSYDPEEHFWLDVKNGRARVGYDALVQESMGAFVVVQLRDDLSVVKRGEAFGTIEAEKYVGPLRSPVSGKIIALNEQVIANPRLANTEPFGNGWFVEIKLSDFARESASLVTGEAAVREWFERELEKYEDKGWLAEI